MQYRWGASENACWEEMVRRGYFANTKAEIWRPISQKLDILCEKYDHFLNSTFVLFSMVQTACQYDLRYRRYSRFVARGIIFTFNDVHLNNPQCHLDCTYLSWLSPKCDDSGQRLNRIRLFHDNIVLGIDWRFSWPQTQGRSSTPSTFMLKVFYGLYSRPAKFL
jgi:hypothetical protein